MNSACQLAVWGVWEEGGEEVNRESIRRFLGRRFLGKEDGVVVTKE